MATNKAKPPAPQELQLENEVTEGSTNCSDCFTGQQVNINAMNATAVNVVLSKNRTTVIGDNSQVIICERCRLRSRQRVPQQTEMSETKSGLFADGNGTSCLHRTSTKNSKKRRKKRKKASEDQAALKCDVDGNSADGENSDSDHSDKFGHFLQCDSDD